MSYYLITYYYHIAESPARVLPVSPKFGSQLLCFSSLAEQRSLTAHGVTMIKHTSPATPTSPNSLQCLILHVFPQIEELSTPRLLLLQIGNITLHFVGKMKKRDKSFSL